MSYTIRKLNLISNNQPKKPYAKLNASIFAFSVLASEGKEVSLATVR